MTHFARDNNLGCFCLEETNLIWKIDSPDSNVLQVNLTGLPHGLTFQEMRDPWTQVDVDGNGIVNYEEFEVC